VVARNAKQINVRTNLIFLLAFTISLENVMFEIKSNFQKKKILNLRLKMIKFLKGFSKI
jgi:hypothetical protein